MNRQQCYNEIVEAFKQKYDWLGEDFAKQFLLSVASYPIQAYSKPEFRIRRHLLLFWPPGFLKSHLLRRAQLILGDKLSMIMSDVSHAALRGTVEANSFITPYCLKTPFGVSTEFGQVVGPGSQEIVQKLLNVLEEGMVTVSLAKIAYLSDAKIEDITKEHGIRFLDSNTFSYHTNWVLMAGTYNKQFLIDNAFESRFNILTPRKRLDGNIIRFISKAPPFSLSQDTIDFLRSEVGNDKPFDCSSQLPDEVYEHLSTMRDCGQLLSTIACNKWWGNNMTNDEIVEIAKDFKAKHESVWKTGEDKVFDAIESGFNTIEEMMREADLSRRQVYNILTKIRAKPRIIGGKRVWEVL